MKEQLKYRAYAADRDLPLFFKPDWLDIFGTQWKAIHARVGSRDVFFVYHLERKLGFRIIRNPYLTPYSGFVFEENSWNEDIQAASTKILSELPLYHELHLDLWPYEFTIPHPGFQVKKKITNILSLQSRDLVWENYKPALKRQIRKGEKHLTVRSLDDIALFYKLHQKTFEKQDLKALTPFKAFEKVWNACKKMDCGILLFAFDSNGDCHAALFLVYDTRRAYYLSGGTDPAFYGSGAMSLLMNNAIHTSMDTGKTNFDFEGSMVTGVDRFFKNFGPREVHYQTLVHKNSSLLKFIKAVKKK